jgi:hypothetical protein
MRTLGDSQSAILPFVLIWAWGAVYALDRTVLNDKMAGKSFWDQVVVPVAVGLLGGYVYIYAYGLGIGLTNFLFNGKASSQQIRRALIFGGIPQSVSILGYAVLLVVFGREVFDNSELPVGLHVEYRGLRYGGFGDSGARNLECLHDGKYASRGAGLSVRLEGVRALGSWKPTGGRSGYGPDSNVVTPDVGDVKSRASRHFGGNPPRLAQGLGKMPPTRCCP